MSRQDVPCGESAALRSQVCERLERRLLADQVRSLLADHHCRRVRVARRDGRHDRRVRDSQSLQSPHPATAKQIAECTVAFGLKRHFVRRGAILRQNQGLTVDTLTWMQTLHLHANFAFAIKIRV